MAWEGSRAGSAQRIKWAQLVLLHRVLPRDPLNADGVPVSWNTDIAAAPAKVAAVA
jgi:hypothetical protein